MRVGHHVSDYKARNRLIAAYCHVVVVAPFGIQSGTSNTILHAGRLQTPMLFLPPLFDDLMSEGTHRYLREMSPQVCGSSREVVDSIERLSPRHSSRSNKEQSPSTPRARFYEFEGEHLRARTLRALRVEPKGLEELTECLEAEPHELSRLTFKMVLEGDLLFDSERLLHIARHK